MRFAIWLTMAWILAWTEPLAVAEPTIRAKQFEAKFERGSLVALSQGDHVYVRPPAEPHGLAIHRVGGQHHVAAPSAEVTSPGPGQWTAKHNRFDGLPGAVAECTCRCDPSTGDLVVRQQAGSPQKGVWGVGWSIAQIPLDYAIVVPGLSGVRLTKELSTPRQQFDYPMSWEAQLVVVEGRGHGFYVWADDAKGRFKRLVVHRQPKGWRLELITINFAPMDDLESCESVAWRANVYQGDWRVPARHYRDWAEANFRPTPIARQQPGWVKDIRACVIMGLDKKMLQALASRLDPRQTLLYLPAWRSAGYDRDYPEYDKPVAELAPFVELAHELGFRVMLHVNYFGCDPLHPSYQQFEPYQVRDPWGKHEKQWWVWPPTKPDIRFAYINPALRAWRDFFVSAMERLCRRTKTDALHLDQTLCIYNDHNGLIEGRSMLEGNVALHQQLRERLPQVALSGEGLNEATYRFEAFAQRHVAGLDHTTGHWDRQWLARAHPISSYLLRPHTIIYGYLGYAPPSQGQLYAAWNEAYEHWGVIPTLVADGPAIQRPTGFARQLFDEVHCWQKQRLEIDVDGPWPESVAFPYRTSDGRPASRTNDGRLLCDGQEISSTITGATQVARAGSIPGWRAYDGRRLLGLDPARWYPYSAEAPRQDEFHVCSLPEGAVLESVVLAEDLALVRMRSVSGVVVDLAATLWQATCGSRPFEGPVTEVEGPLSGADGASFTASGDTIAAHPPYKGRGSGIAFARYSLNLPQADRLHMTTEVALDPGAVGPGKSDGVTFTARVRCGPRDAAVEVFNATAVPQPLVLDLTPFAGKSAVLELAVDPGPKRSPTFDWARWRRPRIVREMELKGPLAISSGPRWELALSPNGPLAIQREGEIQRVHSSGAEAVVFLKRRPDPISVPLEVASQPRRVIVLVNGEAVTETPPFVGVHPTSNVVGGVRRNGLFAHPPDHGRIGAHMPMTLPREPAVFRSWVGLRDGSKSEGVIFVIEVNGCEIARHKMLPGQWEQFTADLSRWAGQPVLLSLITDSDGPYDCDWACWGEPRLLTK